MNSFTFLGETASVLPPCYFLIEASTILRWGFAFYMSMQQCWCGRIAGACAHRIKQKVEHSSHIKQFLIYCV
jgi:hypothetical protein